MFFRLMRFIVGTYLRIFYKVEFRGYKSLPKKGAYIVIGNHHSNSDPILMTVKFKPQVHYMAKKELFDKPIVGVFFHWIGGIPVERGSKADFGAIDESIDAVKQGKCLGLFPEGKRSKDGKMGKGKSGTALIANKTNADIIPIGLTYEQRGKFRSKIIVEYGKIIKNEELGMSEQATPREMKNATTLMMNRISELRHIEICKPQLEDKEKVSEIKAEPEKDIQDQNITECDSIKVMDKEV